MRAILRIIAFGHRPHVGEGTAIVAQIFIDRHGGYPSLNRWPLHVIARSEATRQSRKPQTKEELDCFAPLAMTKEKGAAGS
jgi:hypothetical protein